MHSPSSSSTIILLIFLSNHIDNGILAILLPKNETIPAVIVFGDSVVDPGNNNNINTIIKCNFSPYGRNFMGGKPTGRFSNGKVPSDLIAEEFGVTELLPAYLDPNLQPGDLLTGVSFASGGAGYDPLTPQIVSVLSLSDQLELFKKYIGKIRAAVGESRTSTILSKSIYVVCAGSDDLANTYYSTPFRRLNYDIPSYTDLMATSASSFLQELYGQGARRVAVFSAPPIGCVPSQRTMGGGVERGCAESRNQAAILFNSKLSDQINSLNKKLPQARLVYFDIYYPLLALIKNPSQFGFETEKKGCCGTGTIEVSILCTRYCPNTCTNADKYIFWDSYHPTEKTYKILVAQLLAKYINDFF